MHAAFESLWQFWVIAVSSIFFLVDPFAAIPTFLAIAGDETAERQRYLARRASTACFIVLSVFAAVGPFIFRLFGLTLPAFEIAGGLILLLIGLDMLQARRSSTQETPTETREGVVKPDASIVEPVAHLPNCVSTYKAPGDGARWFRLLRDPPFENC